jgi:hypothetical protein
MKRSFLGISSRVTNAFVLINYRISYWLVWRVIHPLRKYVHRRKDNHLMQFWDSKCEKIQNEL